MPPLITEGGELVCESVGKADLLSDHFDCKQSREAVDLPLTCHPSPSLTTFAFRLSEVRRLLLDLDPYGGTDALGMFSLFLKRTADVMASIVQIDFSAAFDRVNHLGILYKLCSVVIGSSVLSILIQFLSNRSQQVMVDGCRSKLVNVVSGVPQGSVLARYCSSCTLRSFSILENKLIGYAHDSTLMAVVPPLASKLL